MILKPLSFILFIFFSVSLSAQKQDYIWLDGYQTNQNGSGANGYIFDFNQNKMTIKYANLALGILGNNASICDNKGQLLFYTNGRGVINRHHQIMPNGDSINTDPWADKLWPNPFRGYPGDQDAMILQDPGTEDGYYLFHKKNIYFPMFPDSQALNYTYIDMSLDNGLGDVVTKNVKYYENLNSLGNYFTAIHHENQRDWWILQAVRNDSFFLSFLLDDQGIKRMPNQASMQYFDSQRSSSSGTAKFSPDGSKYVVYNYYDQLHIYDFDRSTGILSNHKKINVFSNEDIDREQIRFSSVEWSPNGRFIYTASQLELHQVDLWAENPQDHITLIDTYNGTVDPFPTPFFLMVQGPDCKIYLAAKNGSNSMHVINKPNELGKSCDFVQNGIKLPYPNGGTLPNFPRFRVDEAEKCDPTILSVLGVDVFYRRDIEVYPNPSSGIFTIRLPDVISKAELIVINTNGQIIFSKQIQNSTLEEIDITNHPAGRYNIEVYPDNNKERIFYGKQVVKI